MIVSREVLGDLASPQHHADLQGDLGLAAERVAGARRRRLDLREILLGCGEQVFALARPLGGQSGVPADDQPFAREIGRADLGHVPVVEERQLQRPVVGCQRLDGGRPERGDPVEPGGLQLRFDPGTGDHAAVADQHHP